MKLTPFCLTILAVLFLPAAFARADEPVPVSDYIVEVGDGRFIFVMLAADSAVVDEIQDKGIRAQYDKSGLYETGKAEEALWTVDWYALEVDITPDGNHLVRWGAWPGVEDYDALALEFYENGELLRSYRVSDLVAAPQKLPRTVSHLSWVAESEFDAEGGELYLRTENGEEVLFDVTTGDIVENRRPIRAPACSLVGGIVVLAPVGGSILRRRIKPSTLPQ